METNPYDYDRTVPWYAQEHRLMETNPCDYDRTVPWYAQEHQLLEDRYASPAAYEEQKLKVPKRMSKVQALALARSYKKWLVIASLVGFGVFSGVIAYQQAEVSANSAASEDSQVTPMNSSSSNGFFEHRGEHHFGHRHRHDSQGPFSGTHTS
jgi:hypothetical protein